MEKLIDRNMLGIVKRGTARKFVKNRPPAHPPHRNQIALSDKAMRLIDDLAEKTDSTRSEVLARSVTLYKIALESRRKDKPELPASSS